MDSTPSSNEVATALATVARRLLVRGKPVDLPELGRLEVRHQRSTIDEQPDGETILQPPRDHVVFIPST
jgi:nucleoid DNA-binding protein